MNGALNGLPLNVVPLNGSFEVIDAEWDGADIRIVLDLTIEERERFRSPRFVVVPRNSGCTCHSGLFVQLPDDRLDYDVLLYRWLTETDNVLSATVTPEASDMPVTATVQLAHDFVKVWISGGVDGLSTHVSVLITTVLGRTKEVCLNLRIRDCH